MRGVLTIAARIEPGDAVVGAPARVVVRTTGVQGRKPKSGAPLMRLVFDDGGTQTLREDAPVRVLPGRLRA